MEFIENLDSLSIRISAYQNSILDAFSSRGSLFCVLTHAGAKRTLERYTQR